MKKVILSMIILVLSLSLFFGLATVYADASASFNAGDLLQIGESTTFAYVDNASLAGYKLPSGYWVKYVGKNNTMHEVEYNGVHLLVSNTDINNMNKYNYTDKTVATTYVHEPIKVQPRDEYADDINFFKTTNFHENKHTLRPAKGTELALLNVTTNTDGKPIFLVATSDNLLGYVLQADTNTANFVIPEWVAPKEPEVEPEVPDNPTEPEVKPDEDTEDIIPDTGAPETDAEVLPTTNNIVKIVLIVSICVLSAVLVFLIFKPTRTRKSGRYSVDDDDDYDRDDSYSDRY